MPRAQTPGPDSQALEARPLRAPHPPHRSGPKQEGTGKPPFEPVAAPKRTARRDRSPGETRRRTGRSKERFLLRVTEQPRSTEPPSTRVDRALEPTQCRTGPCDSAKPSREASDTVRWAYLGAHVACEQIDELVRVAPRGLRTNDPGLRRPASPKDIGGSKNAASVQCFRPTLVREWL